MKKFFVLLGTLAAAALFFSCANSSSDNSAALLAIMTPTKTTVSKTIKIGGVEYSYTIVDGQPQASGGVSVAADGTVTITAADGSKVSVKGETITYTTADSKVYVGSGSSGDITLVNQANPNDKITAAVTSQTKTESAQQQSEASRLPPSVGTNELAGKTFKSTGYSIKFETDTLTSTMTSSNTGTTYNTAYDMVLTETYSYTYDSNLKVFYCIEQKSESTFVRNGVKLDMPKADFSTDAEFIAYQKNIFKLQYDLVSDEYIEAETKKFRYLTFAKYGYTDSSGETPVSNDIIARYNEAQKQKYISTMSYSVSDTRLKLVGGNRFPFGKDFSELFNHNYNNLVPLMNPGELFFAIKDGSDNTVYGLYQFVNVILGQAQAVPSGGSAPSTPPAFTLPTAASFPYNHILKSDGLLAYKISSVDANAIHTSATGTRTNTTSDFSFTNESKTFKYTTTKSENGAVVDIEGLGKINIVYATPATIPDFTSAAEYTLQQ